MKKIILDDLQKIIKLKYKFRRELNVNILVKDNELYIDGLPRDEYFAE